MSRNRDAGSVDRHLDRDVAVEIGVVCQVDDPEPPPAQDPDHPVTADEGGSCLSSRVIGACYPKLLRPVAPGDLPVRPQPPPANAS